MKENNKYSVVLDKKVYQRVVDIVKSTNFHDNELSDDNKIFLITNNIINEHIRIIKLIIYCFSIVYIIKNIF